MGTSGSGVIQTGTKIQEEKIIADRSTANARLRETYRTAFRVTLDGCGRCTREQFTYQGDLLLAILQPGELTELRQQATRNQTVDFSKQTINAALQALEDLMESNRVALSNAINSATAPYMFTPVMKRRLFALWCRQKFKREGV